MTHRLQGAVVSLDAVLGSDSSPLYSFDGKAKCAASQPAIDEYPVK
jgi:hypothetical protein